MIGQPKNEALEGLRGVACANVVIGHFLFAFFPYLAHNVRPYPSPVARGAFDAVMIYPPFTLFYLADAAVSVFFVLSGYVLTRRFYAGGDAGVLEPAAARRYIRLVVPAFASVMFAWLLLVGGAYGNHLAGELGAAGWVLAFYTEPIGFARAVWAGFVDAPLFGRVDLNGPLWTLQVELLGSIMLFAFYAAFGHRKLLLVFWFVFFSYIVSGGSPNVLYYVAILAGSLIHVVEKHLRRSVLLSTACIVLGIIGVSFNFSDVFRWLHAWPLPDLTPYGPDFETNRLLFWNTGGAIFLVAGVLGDTPLRRVLANRLLVRLGRVSFSMYLLHWPLIMAVAFRTAELGQSMGLGYEEYAALAFVVTMTVLLVLSALFYRYVDVPSIRLANAVAGGVRDR